MEDDLGWDEMMRIENGASAKSTCLCRFLHFLRGSDKSSEMSPRLGQSTVPQFRNSTIPQFRSS